MPRFLISRIALVTAFLLATTSLLAAPPVGTPRSQGQSVEWQLSATGHDAVTVTVLTPSGETYVVHSKGAKNPSFSLRELAEVEDGEYNYELRVTPQINSSVKAQLRAARSAGNDASVRSILKRNGLDRAIVQAGHFVVLKGSIVTFDGTEPDANDAAARPGAVTSQGAASGTAAALPRPVFTPAVNDQVIPDDLIVQSSTCTGFDCVNGESFGVDTLRLKENNLRIHFDDTSTSAGFASNDWRIIANDQPSGGANKFSIEDSTAARNPFTIEAAAPANALYVDSTGNIGFQQASPGLDLHLTTTDTPAFRMEQTNGGGFTAQTWDIGANEANFFVRDLTGGSRLSFRIRPGAPTSSIDIAADGDVGIGDASPEAPLHVEADARNPGAGQSSIYVESANNEDAIVGLGAGPSFSDNTDGFLFGYNGAAGVGRGFVGTRPTTGTGQIDFAVKNVTEMRLTSTGLEVTDAIRVGGVTLSVPDYVFAENYDLMPLPELKKFLEANKHLPDVPGEAEIKEKGLDLAGFQMNLLRKIEELTLYTVAQDEMIRELQGRLAQLENQVKK